jgi:hypothetical protein
VADAYCDYCGLHGHLPGPDTCPDYRKGSQTARASHFNKGNGKGKGSGGHKGSGNSGGGGDRDRGRNDRRDADNRSRGRSASRRTVAKRSDGPDDPCKLHGTGHTNKDCRAQQQQAQQAAARAASGARPAAKSPEDRHAAKRAEQRRSFTQAKAEQRRKNHSSPAPSYSPPPRTVVPAARAPSPTPPSRSVVQAAPAPAQGQRDPSPTPSYIDYEPDEPDELDEEARAKEERRALAVRMREWKEKRRREGHDSDSMSNGSTPPAPRTPNNELSADEEESAPINSVKPPSAAAMALVTTGISEGGQKNGKGKKQRNKKNNEVTFSCSTLKLGISPTFSPSNPTDSWVVDSGATFHLVPDLAMLTEPTALGPAALVIRGIGNTIMHGTHVGTYRGCVQTSDGTIAEFCLPTVHYVADLGYTLFSPTAAQKRGFEFHLSSRQGGPLASITLPTGEEVPLRLDDRTPTLDSWRPIHRAVLAATQLMAEIRLAIPPSQMKRVPRTPLPPQ